MTANSTPRTIPPDGAAETVDGRYVLRFERRFRMNSTRNATENAIASPTSAPFHGCSSNCLPPI